MVVGFIRRRLGIAAIKAQCHSLLGRVEMSGPGAVTAVGRRIAALEQEQLWRRETEGICFSS